MNLLHSKIVGDSDKNIIIVHGFLGMGDNWKSHANKIAKSGFKVHLIDLRNHGKSFWSNEFSFDLMVQDIFCLLYTSPSPRDKRQSRMPSSA